jgi:U3 small nucleolar RNA-associated protein 11
VARKKLGLLEKHKDYVKRAKNYHQKQATLKALRVRAYNRNPDEFNFGMIKSKFRAGKHVTKNETLTSDMLKLMKTQDVSYIGLQRHINGKKLQKEQEQLAVFEGAKPTHKHVIFADDQQEASEIKQRLLSSTKTPAQSLAQKDDLLSELHDPFEAERRRLRSILKSRKSRLDQLEVLEKKMKLDVQLLAKGKREKIGQDSNGFAIYKWAPQRKK